MKPAQCLAGPGDVQGASGLPVLPRRAAEGALTESNDRRAARARQRGYHELEASQTKRNCTRVRRLQVLSRTLRLQPVERHEENRLVSAIRRPVVRPEPERDMLDARHVGIPLTSDGRKQIVGVQMERRLAHARTLPGPVTPTSS